MCQGHQWHQKGALKSTSRCWQDRERELKSWQGGAQTGWCWVTICWISSSPSFSNDIIPTLPMSLTHIQTHSLLFDLSLLFSICLSLCENTGCVVLRRKAYSRSHLCCDSKAHLHMTSFQSLRSHACKHFFHHWANTGENVSVCVSYLFNISLSPVLASPRRIVDTDLSEGVLSF